VIEVEYSRWTARLKIEISKCAYSLILAQSLIVALRRKELTASRHADVFQVDFFIIGLFACSASSAPSLSTSRDCISRA